ncbi:hypothetical protein BHYA_0122g00320 [Botrytis hyacinthi]|uniref:Uncharacterized protein n=1 Tax=Botrytis hyacinthi TaxID=278943 RepID=A0A4Z1GMJ4_9HELO|nr:hypothetical protein BHYA_0122g00320 [Botrytis hyacinthi]
MSKNSLDNLAPSVKPDLFDPRKKKAPQQLLTQRSNFKGGATQPSVDAEMGDVLDSEPGVLDPQQGSQGVVSTQPAEKKEAAIFGSGMYGTVSADGNNKFQSSKIFGISFNGGKKVDEDTLKLQLRAVDEELKAYKKDCKERFDTLEGEIVRLKAENRQLEDKNLDKSKQLEEILGIGGGADWRDTASQNTAASNSTIERLRNEKATLTAYNGRIIREKGALEKKIVDLEEEINGLESADQSKTRRLQAIQDVLAAAKICHQNNMDQLQTKYNELSDAFDGRENDCRKLDVQVNELQVERDQLQAERDRLRQDIADAKALDLSDYIIESLTEERDTFKKEVDDARAQGISSARIQSLTNERDQVTQQLNHTRQQLNGSMQKESDTQAQLASIMAEIEKMKPEFHRVSERAATVDGLNQTIHLLQAELNTVKNDLTNANTELSQAIEAREQTISAANQALSEANSTNSANSIQQLRTSIMNLESEKTMQQIRINTLEADITKIHKDHEHSLLAVQQNHQHIADEKDAASEGHQNRLSLIQSQHQEMVKEKDEMIQRLRAEVSAGEASIQELVLDAKKSAGASELEENQIRGELDGAKTSFLEVQYSNKLIRGDLTKLQTEIESAKNHIVKTDTKAKLAEKRLAETVDLLVKEQNAHKEWKKNHFKAVNGLVGMGKTSMLKAHFDKIFLSNATDQDGLFEVEEESVTPVRTRTIVCDAPLRASSFAPDASDIALTKVTFRAGLENARAEAKAEFTEEVKTELRKELVETIKVELREELAESVKAKLEEALLTSSAILGSEVQTSQEFVMAYEGQENSLNLAGIVTSDPATSTLVPENANRNATAINGSLLDRKTSIPVIVSKAKLLPRSKVYSWSMFLFILLLASFFVGCLRGPDISSTPGVVHLIDAPRPAIIPVATINASHFATRTISRLAVIPATASASVQNPQVTTVAVLSGNADCLTPILYRSGLIHLHRFVVKFKPVVVTWEALKTSFERVASFFSGKH